VQNFGHFEFSIFYGSMKLRLLVNKLKNKNENIKKKLILYISEEKQKNLAAILNFFARQRFLIFIFIKMSSHSHNLRFALSKKLTAHSKF
jgi:hypothetical protein